MKNYLIKIFMLIGVVFFVVSCGGSKNKAAEKAPPEEQHDEKESENTATLTNEQIKSVGIEMGSIEEKQLTASLKTNGVLRVPNQNKATVNSVYRGTVKSLLVQPGNAVKKGQIIATVANPEFVQVQSDYLNVTAKIGLAELEVTRQRELNAGNAGALKNLQSAETELRTLHTAKSTYEQQIRLMGLNPSRLSKGQLISVLSIPSPISGVVSEVKVEIGSYIDVSTTVAEIVDNSQLHLDLFVYEKDLSKLKNNQSIHFTLTNNPGKEYDAKIYSLGSSFEGESKAVTVHAKVEGNKTGLIDGMNIVALISLEKATVPAVPAEAVVTIAGQDYIFMLVDHHDDERSHEDTVQTKSKVETPHEEGLTFEKIPVAKGTTDVGYTEITLLKQIPKNAKVVVKGAFFVQAKMTNSGEGEHGH